MTDRTSSAARATPASRRGPHASDIPELACPKCHGVMRTYARGGLIIELCEDCRGIFLDNGELERLIDAEGGGWSGIDVRGRRPEALTRSNRPTLVAPDLIRPAQMTSRSQPPRPRARDEVSRSRRCSRRASWSWTGEATALPTRRLASSLPDQYRDPAWARATLYACGPSHPRGDPMTSAIRVHAVHAVREVHVDVAHLANAGDMIGRFSQLVPSTRIEIFDEDRDLRRRVERAAAARGALRGGDRRALDRPHPMRGREPG